MSTRPKSGKRDLPANAPMPFKKEWRKIVIDETGKIDRRLWETATLAHLRNKWRSGNAWVERSANYRRFDSYLLPPIAAAPIAASLGVPATAGERLESRGRELDWRLKRFAHRLKRGLLDGRELRDKRLHISPVRAAAPADAEKLADQLDGFLPPARLTEILHEVARDKGFLSVISKSIYESPKSGPPALTIWKRGQFSSKLPDAVRLARRERPLFEDLIVEWVVLRYNFAVDSTGIGR